jgi:DNA-binding NarL/FixJ family response regulator
VQPITIIISTDQSIYSKGLYAYLTETAGLQLVGTAFNAGELLQLAQQHQPCIVLIDTELPAINATETCRLLSGAHPQLGIIALGTYNGSRQVKTILQSGVRGYLTKNSQWDRVLNAIKEVHSGGTAFSPECTPLVCDLINERMQSCPLPEIKQKLVRLQCLGYTSKQMAKALCRSVYYINGLRCTIYKDCGVSNIGGLVLFALHWNLMEPGEIGWKL